MTISTRRIEWPRARPAARSRAAGFTLVEVMVSATISTFILAGILSALVMIGRSGFLASSYSEMEQETRRAMDIFGQDTRKASDIRWNSSQSVTLYVATSTNTTVPTTYAYDPVAGSPTFGSFYRMFGEAGSTMPRLVLVRNVTSDLVFQRYKLETNAEDSPATTDLETKQLQLTFQTTRLGATAIAANHNSLSARYILRNKRVSN